MRGRSKLDRDYRPGPRGRGCVARLKASPFIPHPEAIRGFVFDVDTGKLNEVS